MRLCSFLDCLASTSPPPHASLATNPTTVTCRYMEDYNTSTLPHIKYYDMEAWEKEDYNKQQARNAKKRSRTRTEFNDEDVEVESRRCVHIRLCGRVGWVGGRATCGRRIWHALFNPPHAVSHSSRLVSAS